MMVHESLRIFSREDGVEVVCIEKCPLFQWVGTKS